MLNKRIGGWVAGHGTFISVTTWVSRIVVGTVFLLSGFSKAIDPWGLLYKVDAYLASMSLELWPNLITVGVFGLCALEFFIGFSLIAGCLRRTTPILVAVVMTFMLPFTLWTAISNPVDDCGCFGDALVISNWATFWKNVVLSLFVVWLLLFNRYCHWLITPALQWISVVATGLFIVIIELFGYISQPLIDFRPYKDGEYLIDLEDVRTDDPEYVFIYENNGVRKEFKETDELPDEADGWTFIDRIEINSDSAPSDMKKSKNLRIWSKDGEEDLTEDAVDYEGKELMVMIAELKAVSPATTWKLNSLYEWSVKNDVRMIGVVSGSLDDISDWEDLSMASYPIYSADDTQIKEVVRGNPGIVYLENGKIVWKSTLTAINIDDFLSPDTSDDAKMFGLDNSKILVNSCLIYVMTIAVLVFLSFTPVLKKFYLSRQIKIAGKLSDQNRQ